MNRGDCVLICLCVAGMGSVQALQPAQVSGNPQATTIGTVTNAQNGKGVQAQSVSSSSGIQTTQEAARARAREDEADQRERENLELQKRVTDATEIQARTSKWQLWLGLLGGGVLFWTLWETRKTARSAERSAALAESSFQISQRAYLSCELNRIERRGMENGRAFCVRAGVSIVNRGRTPAKNVMVWIGRCVVDGVNTPPNFNEISFVRDGGEMGPDDFTGAASDIEIENFQRVVDNTGAIYVVFRVKYDDMFGNTTEMEKIWKVRFSVYPNNIYDMDTTFHPEWRPYNVENQVEDH